MRIIKPFLIMLVNISSVYAQAAVQVASPYKPTAQSASASNVYEKNAAYSAYKAVDGDPATKWATDRTVTAATITIQFFKERKISKISILEAIERMQAWELDLMIDGKWKSVCKETAHRAHFPSSVATAARIKFTGNAPTISEIQFRDGDVKDHFEPTVASLAWYECPEWIQDAKFGIYCHWNGHTASKSANNGWYARDMYIQGSQSYKDHLKNWGHPSKVGYKDILEAWEAPKFDADRWIRLFKNAGAKYVLTMAVHHDNFDMWNSKHQPKWNSMHYGPLKDVCLEMKTAALKQGLRWGVSTHLGRTYSWLQTNKGADSTGSLKGVPYDGNIPEYKDLYLEKPDFSKLGDNADMLRHPLHTPLSWRKNWKARMYDIIDNYQPDFFYFDGASPFMDDKGQSGLDVIAHHYNKNAERHNGKNEGVMVIKDITRHGYYYSEISSVVLERRRSNKIVSSPRITEQSVGPWFQVGQPNYRSSSSLIHEMVDVISKNCVFQLNIPPQADGSIDDACVKILEDFGSWFEVNGIAIYSTRPWHVFGEHNLRYTTKANVINAIALNKPDHETIITAAVHWKKEDIKSIELLGEGPVEWKLTEKGLVIIPSITKLQLAYTFQITCTKPASDMPAGTVALPSAEKDNKAAKKAGADGNGGEELQDY